MKKLDLIIEELEDRLYRLEQELAICLHPGDVDYIGAYNVNRAMVKVKEELHLYMNLHDPFVHQKNQIEGGIRHLQDLLKQVRSEKTDYNRPWSSSMKIETLIRKIKDQETKLATLSEEGHLSKSKEPKKDFVLKAIEELLSDKIDKFELKFKNYSHLGVSLLVKKNLKNIELYISQMLSPPYDYKIDPIKKRKLKAIGYREVDGLWIYDIPFSSHQQDVAVLGITRTLIDFFSAHMNKEFYLHY